MTTDPAQPKKTVSLVLGSGGARGMAHIGVIRWLEANGYEIRSIAGCSMGALVGGVYAAGKLEVFEQWALEIRPRDLVTLLDISWGPNGLVKGDKIIVALAELLGDIQIENLSMPYTAVAADVVNEKEVWLSRGSLADAIRASISLPLFFTPFAYKGVSLVDGGVLNPVPIAPTFDDGTDLTVAVNLGGKRITPEMRSMLERWSQVEKPVKHSAIDRFINRLASPASKPVQTNDHLGMYELANQSFDAMQSTLGRQKLAAYPPDVEIEIPRDACGTFEFDKTRAMIRFGYQKAGEAMYAQWCSHARAEGDSSGSPHED
jgi:NTE family protein